MKLTKNFKNNLDIIIKKELNVGKSFDILERIIDVHNTPSFIVTT